MAKVSVHLTDGEIISLDDVTAIHTIHQKITRTYSDDAVAMVPIRNAFAYIFESADRNLNLSGEQIKYVDFTNH